MVTIQKIGKIMNENVLELVGISTDVKPLEKINEVSITNGSTYMEMDTAKVFMYDEENHKWYDLADPTKPVV